MYRSYLSVLLGFLLSLNSDAELRDPTKPEYPPVVVAPAPSQPPEKPVMEAPPVLSATWITPYSKRATLNDVTAKEGQTILNNIQIIKISHNQVVIKQNSKLKTLRLLQRTTQTP